MMTGQFFTVPAPLQEGQPCYPLVDINRRLIVSVAAGSLVGSGLAVQVRQLPVDLARHVQGPANTGVIANGQATLWFIYANSTVNQNRWLHLFDAAAVPIDGSTPLEILQIPTRNNGGAFLEFPMHFTTGVIWAASTTMDTLTISAGTPLVVRARYQLGPAQ